MSRPVQRCYVLSRLDTDTLVPWFKVGISVDPWRRARAIGEDVAVYAVAEWENGRFIERYVHELFGHLRHRRDDWEGKTEWFFDEEDEIARFVDEVDCFTRVAA